MMCEIYIRAEIVKYARFLKKKPNLTSHNSFKFSLTLILMFPIKYPYRYTQYNQ